MCFRCSKEPPHWDGSFEYPQHMFWLRNKKIIFSYTLLSGSLKQHLILNHLVEFHQTSQGWSLDDPLSKLLKDFHSMQNSGCLGNLKEKNFKIFLSKSSYQKLLVRLQNKISTIVDILTFTSRIKIQHENFKAHNGFIYLYFSFYMCVYQLRVCNENLIFLFLNQNICCGYSKEPSQWEGSFERPKHMLKDG